MNSKATILTNIIILAAGLLLCYVHGRDNIPHTIVLVTGLTLVIPALINMFLLFRHRSNERHLPTSAMKIAGWISSVAAIGLGALMVIAPGIFTPVLVYIFGGMMIVASVMLLYLLTVALKQYGLPGWLYIGYTGAYSGSSNGVCRATSLHRLDGHSHHRHKHDCVLAIVVHYRLSELESPSSPN